MITETMAEAGLHRSAISRWLRQGPPPVRRVAADGAKAMTRRWVERVEALVVEHPRLLGVSVWRCSEAEGAGGYCSTTTPELRHIRGPRLWAADPVSVPIHTEPGEDAQPWVPAYATRVAKHRRRRGGHHRVGRDEPPGPADLEARTAHRAADRDEPAERLGQHRAHVCAPCQVGHPAADPQITPIHKIPECHGWCRRDRQGGSRSRWGVVLMSISG